MFNLDPAKLLVILVIALIVVGPERLPRFARQLGAMLREFSRVRERMLSELKEQVPDLPSLPDLSPRNALRSLMFDPENTTGPKNVRPGAPSINETPPSGLTALSSEERPRVWTAAANSAPPELFDPAREPFDPTMN